MFKQGHIKNYKIAVYLVFAIFLISGCQEKAGKNNNNNVIYVKVIKVQASQINEVLEYVGDIKAQDEAVVYPKVSGKIIQKVKEDGSFVEKQGTIAYIDRDEVGLKFERAPVESPISGVVGRVFIDIGQNVTEQTPIALVVNMDKVKINLDVPEKHLPKVSLGQDAVVTVDAYPGEEFSGKVTKISPVVDLSTRAAPIEITVDNAKHLLKSGMFAKVNLIVKELKQVPVILKEAVMGKEPNQYVYIVEGKKAALKKIVLGIRRGPYYSVKEGLKEGDLVVVMGQQKLYEGAQVVTEE